MDDIVKIGDATLYLGDCMDILPTLGKVDAVVTSPPYGDLRDYGGEYHKSPVDLINLINLTDGGVCVWNVADQVIDGSESGESFRQALLYLGDCMDILPTLGKVDAVVTDPPYGVGLTGKRMKGRSKQINNCYSDLTIDDESIFDRIINPALFELSSWDIAIITPGIRLMWQYPKPDDVGCAFHPAGAGLGRWGFCGFHPILYYGKCPYLKNRMGHRPSSIEISGKAGVSSEDRHPVAKPIRWMEFLVTKASVDSHVMILDPFMGSGTTGVACANLVRKFIGIEIERKYFDIACERIEAAYAQGRLF